MGLNINKVMGWYYPLNSNEKSTIEDLRYDYEVLNKLDINLTKLQKNDKYRDCLIGLNCKNVKIQDFVHFIENDSESVIGIMITPPMFREEWSRMDDDLDYHESKNSKTKINYLNKGIFPFVGLETLSVSTQKTLSPTQKTCLALLGKEGRTLPKKMKDQYKKLGLDVNKASTGQVYTKAPDFLLLVAEKLGLESPIKLRPAIVTHWR